MRMSGLLALAALLPAGAALAAPFDGYDPTGKRDPFHANVEACADDPAGRAAAPERALACASASAVRLTALVVDTAAPRALIEDADGRGHMVRVGDVIAHRRVLSITREGVRLGRPYAAAIRVAVHETLLLSLQRS